MEALAIPAVDAAACPTKPLLVTQLGSGGHLTLVHLSSPGTNKDSIEPGPQQQDFQSKQSLARSPPSPSLSFSHRLRAPCHISRSEISTFKVSDNHPVEMPRLVRRQPLRERIMAAINPMDFLLWLSEELETRDWDSATVGTQTGLAMNFLFLLARANSGSTTKSDDIFSDDTSSGWLSFVVSTIWFLYEVDTNHLAL